MTWYTMKGTTLLGIVFLSTGLGIIVMNEVKKHPWDHFVLGIAVGLMVVGAHFISRTAVANAASDLGKFLPFGKKADGQQPPTDGQ